MDLLVLEQLLQLHQPLDVLVVVECRVVLDRLVVVSDEELGVLGAAVLLNLGFKIFDPLNYLFDVSILHHAMIDFVLFKLPLLLVIFGEFDTGGSQVSLDTLDAVVGVLVHLDVEDPGFFLTGETSPEELDVIVRFQFVADLFQGAKGGP